MHFFGKIIKTAIELMSILFFLFVALLLAAPFWPSRYWWIANFFLISPLWTVAVTLSCLFLAGLVLRNKKILCLNGLSLLILLFPLMGLTLPLSRWQPAPTESALTLKLMTANVGEEMDMPRLFDYIQQVQPDIILFQEVYGPKEIFFEKKLPSGRWEFASHNGLAVASRLSILDVDAYGPHLLGVDLEGPDGPLYVCDVHLGTPRSGIEAILSEGAIGRWTMQGATDIQEQQSSEASSVARDQKRFIVAGDFNLVTSNPLYKKYWAGFQNAFSAAGAGFGHTKFTPWYSVRIDHILPDRGWTVIRAEVGPDCQGDHRPLYAEITRPRDAVPAVKQAAPVKKEITLPPVDQVYVYEDFESKPLKLMLSSSMELSLHYDANHGKTLQADSLNSGDGLFVSLPMSMAPQFPVVKFSYRIPQDVPLVLRVMTGFGDWIDLAGTRNSSYLDTRSKTYTELLNDGQWHEMDMNVLAAVRTVLKSIQSARELQFVIPAGPSPSTRFFLDDFLIYRK